MTQEDVITVFPLPNVVFFPRTKLPLHIFEPRYFHMVRDAIQNQQLIGMFLLSPGWQADYYGNPPCYEVGCAGELAYFEELPDQKYNIVLNGLYRARLIETVQEFPYRKARVEVLPEFSSKQEGALHRLKVELRRDFEKLLHSVGEEESGVLKETDDFVEVVHVIASILQIDQDVKLRLLKENDIFLRGKLVGDLLKKQISVMELTKRFGHLRSNDPSRN